MSTILDCPKCEGGPVIVYLTKRANDENAILRLRVCEACEGTFETLERPVEGRAA